MITNNIYGDGFGENFKFIIFSMMYAEYNKMEFHYTPLNNKIEHNYDNDPEFIDKKEKLINIKNHFPIIKQNIKYSKPDRFELLHFFENNTEFCANSNTLKKLKSIFYEVNINNFDNDYINIAIHIRRMNQLDISRKECEIIPGTDVPNILYEDIINQFRKKIKFKKIKFHIYSQGEEKDFSFEDDVILHLNESIEKTFIDFVYSDILIVAPSSFSYSAGLLSNNVVFIIKNADTPLPYWKTIENYISTKNRYGFYINVKNQNIFIQVYYDTKLGKFYRELYHKNNNSIIYEYINIMDYF